MMKFRFWQLLLLAIFVGLFTFLYRGMVAERELSRLASQTDSSFQPYTIEGGIMYGYIRRLANGEAVTIDSRLADETNSTVEAQMSLGLERLLANSIRLRRWLTKTPAVDSDNSTYEDNPAETAFMRKVILAVISFIPVAVLIILICSGCGGWLSLCGALLSAVSVAAMARYTGEDLLKGNLVLPMLMMVLASCSSYKIHPRRWKLLLIVTLTYFSAANWDATQLFLGVWGGIELLRLLFGGIASRRALKIYGAIWAGLLLASVLSPYCRLHHLILSPTVMIIYPAVVLFNGKKLATLVRWVVLAIAVGVAVPLILATQYAVDYNHFTSLLWAKIRFLNVKPTNPDLLTYEQRYLWTPALNSVSFKDFTIMFPVMLWVLAGILLLSTLIKSWRKRLLAVPNVSKYMLMLLVYFPMYILFYRFGVFAALFGSILLCMALQPFYRHFNKVGKVVIILLFIGGILVPEAMQRWSLNRRYSGSMKPIAELTAYLRTLPVDGELILANMDISGVLKGYCDSSIIIQPKFELASVRQQVEDYTKLMFDEDSSKFINWCEANNIQYFIYSRGSADWDFDQHSLMLSGYQGDQLAPHIYSARYMAASHLLSPSSIAFQCEFKPEAVDGLVLLDVPTEYSELSEGFYIFKVVTPNDKFLAEFDAELSLEALAEYDIDSARNLAKSAFYRYPSDFTYECYCRVFKSFPPPPMLNIYLKDIKK